MMEDVDFAASRLARWRTSEFIVHAADIRRELAERWLDHAVSFRAFAESWRDLAMERPADRGTPLRRAAQAALYAAYEAEAIARRYFDDAARPMLELARREPRHAHESDRPHAAHEGPPPGDTVGNAFPSLLRRLPPRPAAAAPSARGRRGARSNVAGTSID